MGFDTREFEYADIKVKMLGAELTGLRGLTYKKSQEKELVYGAGNRPKAVQRGNKKYEGSLMLLKSDFDLLNKAAVAAGYGDLTDVPGKLINTSVVYQKEGDALIQTATLLNVEFTEFEDGMKQGDKFKEITLPFICLNISIL
jgi:hypothetical protein